VTDLNLDAIEHGSLRTPASAAIKLVGSAFLFALRLPRIQKIDQVAAMHENRPAIIDGAKPSLDPSPNRVRMEVKQIGKL
jgi:hypothetical protein